MRLNIQYDEHSITTDELIRIYEENGYKANRKPSGMMWLC